MDNFELDVTCRGKDYLKHAVTIAFHNYSRAKAVANRVDKKLGLIFYWTLPDDWANKGISKLLFPHDIEATTDLIWNWLQALPDEDYLDWLDIDGSLVRGWRLYNETWGRVNGERQTFFAVQPVWGWSGK